MTAQLTLVIPAFEEAATIASVIARAEPYVSRIIVVDDGSTDATAAQSIGASVAVLRNPVNAGKGASLGRGFASALTSGAEAIVTMDADGQHDPQEIPRLVAAARRHPHRIIIAARSKNRLAAPIMRRFANRFADFWISWAAGYPIRDSQSGFRLYPASVLHALEDNSHHYPGFAFESELLIAAAGKGYYSDSIPIATIYHPDGRKSHYRAALDTVRIVRMVAWKLLRRGMYPKGLLRALHLLPDPRYAHGAPANETTE